MGVGGTHIVVELAAVEEGCGGVVSFRDEEDWVGKVRMEISTVDLQ